MGTPTSGTQPVSGDFVINGVNCRPTKKRSRHANELQLLVHGVTCNSTMWSGYDGISGDATLTIDRPGRAFSSVAYVGHSFSSRVGSQLALEHPADLVALVPGRLQHLHQLHRRQLVPEQGR